MDTLPPVPAAGLSDGLLQAFPTLIYPLLAACGLYAAVVIAILRRRLSVSCRPLAMSLSAEDKVHQKGPHA